MSDCQKAGEPYITKKEKEPVVWGEYSREQVLEIEIAESVPESIKRIRP